VRILGLVSARETEDTSRRRRNSASADWDRGMAPGGQNARGLDALSAAGVVLSRFAFLRGLTAVLATAALALPALAQTVEQEADRIPGIPEKSIAVNFPREFGDPAGVRSALAGRGIRYAVNYIGDVLGNPIGGFDQGVQYMGRLDLELSVDMGKAIGWKGLTFFANGYQIHGQSITAADLGVLMPASFIEALPSTRLFEIYLEQKLLDDHLSFRFGQLSADSEFAISESGSAFLNGSWGWPSILGINLPDGGPSYPLASPAARLAFNPNDNLGFLIGVFSGDPAGNCDDDELPQECNPYGVLFPFTSPLLLYEADIKYNQGDGKLAGKLKLGAWRDFGSFVPQSVGNNGLPIGLFAVPGVRAEKDYGFYVMLDQMIYRLPGGGDPKGITLFGSYMTAPSEGNMISQYFEGGVVMNGLLASRPHDVFGIGFIYTGVSPQIIDYEKSQGFPVIPSFEGVLEVSYTAELMQGLTLQPDFQYFWNPGGHSGNPDDPDTATPNAAVFGLRTTVNY
jgi:porin